MSRTNCVKLCNEQRGYEAKKETTGHLSNYLDTPHDIGSKEENQAVADEYNAMLGISNSQTEEVD